MVNKFLYARIKKYSIENLNKVILKKVYLINCKQEVAITLIMEVPNQKMYLGNFFFFEIELVFVIEKEDEILQRAL